MADINFWNDRNVLITGATGLLGNSLVRELLSLGSNIKVIVRDWNPQRPLIQDGTIYDTSVISGNIEDYSLVSRAVIDCDIIFHLAAQTQVIDASVNPLQTLNSNVMGTYNILEACRIFNPDILKIVIASSDKAYGKLENYSYMETDSLRGDYPYDASKSCVDIISNMYHNTYNLPINVTRCGNLYGGGDLNWQRLIPGTIKSIYRKEAPVIRSDGKFLRDYLYVLDAVNAYLSVAESDCSGEAFNVGPDVPYDVLSIVSLISELMDFEESPIIQNRVSNEIKVQHVDSSKIKKSLGWKCNYTIEQGLKKTIEWYENYFQS